MAAKRAIEAATKKGNEKDVQKISNALIKFTETENYKTLDFKNFAVMAVLSLKNLPNDGQMSPLQQMWQGLSSPYMSLNDLRWYMVLMNIKKYSELEAPVMEELLYKFDIVKLGKEFNVSIYFISGDNDWTTPTVMVEEYYKSIEAPHKDMIVIKNAGHSPFMDNSDAFCKAVKAVLSS